MEDNFYSDDFEQMLREKADEFKLQPRRRVWRSVYNSMHPSRKWPSVVISLLLVTALVFIGYINTDTDKKVVAEENNTPNPGGKTGNSDNTDPRNLSSKDIVNNTASANTAGLTNVDLTGANTTVSQFPTNTNNSQNTINNQPGITTNNRNAQISTVTSERQAYTAATQQSDKINTSGIAETENSKTATGTVEENDETNTVTSTGIVTAAAQLSTSSPEDKNMTPAAAKDNKSLQSVSKNITEENDKAWIDNFAFYNNSNRKKWKDRMAYEYYVTPGISYRSLKSNVKYNTVSPNSQQNPNTENYAINQIPSLSAEIGGAMIYSFAKNLRLKAGVQFNYTSYGIKAYETNHPILTTLTLNDLNSGYPYLDSRSTSIANVSGGTTLHNKTYQVSLPVGLEVKLAGKERLQWYVGATVQPTYIIGGNSYLLSSDKKNYVADNSMIRKWSFNTGMETFISFKTNHGTTLQIGPQVRLQVPSTYGKKFSMDERLFSAGLKLGVVRNF